MSELQKYYVRHTDLHGETNRCQHDCHAVNYADAVDARLALMQRAVEWCLQQSATHGRQWSNERQCFVPGITDQGGRPLQVPADLSDLIVSAAFDNGEEETHL